MTHPLRNIKTTALVLQQIADERARQINAEGYSRERDDTYTEGELVQAAACFLGHAEKEIAPEELASLWPWSRETWKPKTPRDSLVKACALIAAEIERRDRACES